MTFAFGLGAVVAAIFTVYLYEQKPIEARECKPKRDTLRRDVKKEALQRQLVDANYENVRLQGLLEQSAERLIAEIGKHDEDHITCGDECRHACCISRRLSAKWFTENNKIMDDLMRVLARHYAQKNKAGL